MESPVPIVRTAYAAFSLYFLSTPHVVELLGSSFDTLSHALNLHQVASAIAQQFSDSPSPWIAPENRLWLLAQFIALRRLEQKSSQDPSSIKALSLQLSSSSAAIINRIDIDETAEYDDDDDLHTARLPPLPGFVKKQLLTLVDRESISGLLRKFSLDTSTGSSDDKEDASLLASYALTLLRIFPGRGDELRMWLHLGSVTSKTGAQVPALRFFWLAVLKSNIFSQIKADSKSALTLLRVQNEAKPTAMSGSQVIQNREWQTILLFLELYAFVLRFTDDEEFLSPSTISTGGLSSRNRDAALPLDDVRQLTIFLKNLVFTTYYNAGELSNDSQTMVGGLGSYFGTTSTSRFSLTEQTTQSTPAPRPPFAGITGMTFEYLRTVASGVMKMLYERDSRRRFLPKDHWLMTSRFEMEGFIPAVVMEEERRHQLPEDEEEADEELVDDSQEYDRRGNLIGNSRPRRAQQIEAMRKTQQQAARQKMLASIGPRLEVLQNMPFVIPFETRVQIFRQFVLLDQTRRRGGNVDPDIWRMVTMQQAQMQQGRRGQDVLGRHHAKIRRDQIFEDAFEQFYDLGESLKEPIQITFVDKFDTVEAGIDGGGVTKEFLTSVTKEAFQTGAGSLFAVNDQNLLYPNPSAIDERRELLRDAGFREADPDWREAIRDLLNHYEFLGRVVGKCLYEGILVDIAFASFFLLKWAASNSTGESTYRANINDLRDLDESLYQGLLQVKNYPGNVEDLALDFSITDTVSLPNTPTKAITRDLMPNGSNISVTNENRPLYVSYVARHRLQIQPHLQTQAFLKGLGSIITPSWLSMFNQSELQTLIGGDSSEIDVADLRANTQYGGVYVIGDDGLDHPTVSLFWQVMKELDDADRRKVLKYVTSTPRAPLLGFGMLNPRFSIRDAGSDEKRLPSTSTCVNLLKLPRYSTKGVLKDKLLYAVNSGAGFDLS